MGCRLWVTISQERKSVRKKKSAKAKWQRRTEEVGAALCVCVWVIQPDWKPHRLGVWYLKVLFLGLSLILYCFLHWLLSVSATVCCCQCTSCKNPYCIMSKLWSWDSGNSYGEKKVKPCKCFFFCCYFWSYGESPVHQVYGSAAQCSCTCVWLLMENFNWQLLVSKWTWICEKCFDQSKLNPWILAETKNVNTLLYLWLLLYY